MSNFNEDRRQGCVDFKYEPYRENWKDKKYIYKVLTHRLLLCGILYQTTLNVLEILDISKNL